MILEKLLALLASSSKAVDKVILAPLGRFEGAFKNSSISALAPTSRWGNLQCRMLLMISEVAGLEEMNSSFGDEGLTRINFTRMESAGNMPTFVTCMTTRVINPGRNGVVSTAARQRS